MRRREFLATPLAAAAPARATGLCLNEDNSHWFISRAGKELTPEFVAAFVDQYAGTQVRELLFCPNSQRTSFASEVWDPVWKGYDPQGPDDQPLLRSTPAASRTVARKWIHTAWELAEKKIDPYALWIARARKHGIAPWISMRMNDLHNVDDPDSYLHSTFWKQHPEYRRVPWRAYDWRDRAFDYAFPEVQAYHFALIEEYCRRYDFAGLELDWMRFGFHLKPGSEDGAILTGFMRRTRRLLDQWEKKRGHRIALGARVPSRPETARRLGLDGAAWARERLVQMLVVTPFWASIETDMPLEVWRALCGSEVTLAAGLELLLRPYHAYRPMQFNSLETVRGAAAAMLARGADRVYLFNYMDADTQMPDRENYPVVLGECGSLVTLTGKPRRHIVTYPDTLAPGEPQAAALPRTIEPGLWTAFRVPVGPEIEGEVRLEVEGPVTVRANGEACTPGPPRAVTPGPETGLATWRLPRRLGGEAVLDLHSEKGATVRWVEIAGA